MRRTIPAPDLRIAAGLFFVVFITYAWFFGGNGWNQDAQFDMTRALVERHTLYIDGYDANTGDTAVGVAGHHFVNRPPALSFLAVIPYLIVPSQWFCTIATCGLCGALIAVILYLHGRRRYDARPRDAVAIALAVAFGTIVFCYSTMLVPGVPAALFVLLAFVLWERWPFAAGAAAGMATLCYYVCGVPALLLAVLRPNRRFIAGGAPFAILLGAYQWVCFGSPFRLTTETSQFAERGLLFGVIQLPQVEALVDITVSPYRGLFFASPFLLFAVFGLRRMETRERRAIDGIAALFILVIASFNGWHAGWSFGARHLLPIVPLLGVAMLAGAAEAPRALRVLWLAAVLVSAVINFVATAVDAMPTTAVRNPIVEYHFPAFLTGRVTRLHHDFPWYFPTERVPNVAAARGAANLGERWFGKGTRASVLPIALWMIAGSAALLTLARAPSPRRSPPPHTP